MSTARALAPGALQPSGVRKPERAATATTVAIILALLTSMTLLAVAPLLMPPSYSWVAHTTSESAAQGVSGAWVARLGFLLFGLAVFMQATQAREEWGVLRRAPHVTFAVCMVAAAAFAARHWDASTAFDATEDLLHSVAASTMGFAFIVGVAAVWLRRSGTRAGRTLDVLAVAASVAIPLAMVRLGDLAGLLQRGMFLIAYLWYATAALESEVKRRGQA